MDSLVAIRYSEESGLEIIDQLCLPYESVFIKIRDVADGYQAIKKMQVRGAPAIAIVGMLSVAEEIKAMEFLNVQAMIYHLTSQLAFLVTSRPTAVNLASAASHMLECAKAHLEQDSVDSLKARIVKFAVDMLHKDVSDNQAIGKFGSDAVRKSCLDQSVTILTHCNTGSLATAGYGTALGVVRSLHKASCLKHVYCTETRPYNQGARLTAYELVHDNLPATLICDSMAAILMERKNISAVVVGADRVASNGDTANKIGTYQLAIVAKHFNVPFYVCAPFTSIDFTLSTGAEIVIEERSADELCCVQGIRIAAPGISCWNPSFDVTPANLITAIITEQGVFSPLQLASAQGKQ